MKFIIQKFGGTSLASEEMRMRVAEKVISAKEEGYNPVVVVSAIGRRGDPYATDSLLAFACQGNREIPPHEYDLLLSCGEIIAGVVISGDIRQAGYPTVFLTGGQAGIITDNNHTDARILKVEPKNIIKEAQNEKIVVVAGFQGVTQDGEITTLGRGGSDITAVALGVALDAAWVDIYTDVEGVMTADPKIVNDARPLEMITYNEVCQLAHEGAKVIHPRAVEIAMQKFIPLRVRPAFSDAKGTLVTTYGKVYGEAVDIGRDRVITGITYISEITQLSISNINNSKIPDIQLKIFKALALAGISVDFINVNPDSVVFTVKDLIAPKAVKILENMGFNPKQRSGCAKIAAVGAGMTGVPGVMAGIIEALAAKGIQILQSADSYTTIWVLVKQEDLESGIRALHQQFDLGKC